MRQPVYPSGKKVFFKYYNIFFIISQVGSPPDPFYIPYNPSFRTAAVASKIDPLWDWRVCPIPMDQFWEAQLGLIRSPYGGKKIGRLVRFKNRQKWAQNVASIGRLVKPSGFQEKEGSV